ncbi:MAG: DUF3090 family protein [Herpetosiphonaceae bacterium]|nr:DUF3090 family protein [Herpetosiphonaceae bacterium]
MPEFTYDFDPVDQITVGAVGQPGQRTFYLQARRGRSQISFVVEKEQVGALADAVEQLLESLAEKNPLLSTSEDMIAFANMDLREPLEEAFRVGQLGLGYDEGRDLLIIIAQELGGRSDDEEANEGEAERLETARLTFRREQGRALAQRGNEAVTKGRPRCPQCGEPMNPEGHFCPKRNGHRVEAVEG